MWRDSERPLEELLNKIRKMIGLQPLPTGPSLQELEDRLRELYAGGK